MANYGDILRRKSELKFIRNQQGLLDSEINGFIRKTDFILKTKNAIELDSDKMREVMLDLQKLEDQVLQYKEFNSRMSRMKIRHWEQPMLYGQRSDIVGIRRQINRKLEKLLNRIRLVRDNLSLVKFSDSGIAIEQTIKMMGNLSNDGKEGIAPGGDLPMAITLLLVFFIEFVKKRD